MLPFATTGEEWPMPTVTLHSSFKFLGHTDATPGALPSRLGPRHCGQSWAWLEVANKIVVVRAMIVDHELLMLDLPRKSFRVVCLFSELHYRKERPSHKCCNKR